MQSTLYKASVLAVIDVETIKTATRFFALEAQNS